AWVAALATAALALLTAVAGLPVLPLWLAWAAAKSVRHGRWTMAVLLAACALLPIANPTGSPTYTLFGILVAACASTLDEPGIESGLRVLNGATAAAVVGALLVLALAVRAGWPVPGVSRLARPLLAEGERTRQLEVLASRLLDSRWREEP